ncbi:putative membrane protein [Palleronia aestuarii]|uniref:Putative membrane protein n=1 Tax=Palleronia aestuarii TaxID=568105 RepID=A0A2W7NH48_9RHOB|nr:DUF2254 domain-containing protein [Palleronia aestuarii]PZX19735.1 putative membrane protein [Palleronia aestuarii]
MKLNEAGLSKTFFRIRRLSRKLWIRAALIAMLAVVAALLARPLSRYVPDAIANNLSEGSVSEIVKIIASSMLAVTIFSLSIMVAARQTASSQVTPRSHQVLIEDSTTQSVLASFLGAFIFSLVSLIVIDTGYYTGRSSAVILFFTLVVVALVVAAILRWIDQLSDLGSVLETTRRIEDAALAAVRERVDWPCLGARPLTEGQLEIPARALTIPAWTTGYVQHVDLAALVEGAADSSGQVFLMAAPGMFVTEGDPLILHTGDLKDATARKAFTIGGHRVFDQDPRFGVIVLTEIAQRALSPGINDPGTAIDVISRLVRVLREFRDERAPNEREGPHFPSIWIPPVTSEDLVRDAFDSIARDGASTIEVQVRLQKALATLAAGEDRAMREAALAASDRALRITLPEQIIEEHRDWLRRVAVAKSD